MMNCSLSTAKSRYRIGIQQMKKYDKGRRLMRMQDKDIRRLFQKAEIQVCPEQKRILKMYEYLQNEIDKNEYKNKKAEKKNRDFIEGYFVAAIQTYR